MAEDFKLFFLLGLSLLAAFTCMSLLPELQPQSKYWNQDPHLQYFENEIKKEQQADISFFGASATMNGVHTPMISKYLSENSFDNKTINLGVNWFGHDLQNLLVERWAEKHPGKLCILTVPILKRYKEHPNFSKIAKPKHYFYLLQHAPHRAIHSILFYTPRLIYQSLASHLPKQAPHSNRSHQQGWVEITIPEPQKIKHMTRDSHLLEKGMKKVNDPSGLRKFIQDFRYRHHHAFLRKSIQFLKKENIDTILLIIPKLQLNDVPTQLLKNYKELAEVWVPPEDLLQKPGLWRDINHLNTKGAEQLSSWLSLKIANKLKLDSNHQTMQ